MTLPQQIEAVLLELKHASETIQKNHSVWHDVMSEYNLLFLGDKFQVIYSVELAFSLKTKFGIDLTPEDLNEIIPGICSHLGMKISPMVLAEDIGKPDAPIANYSIELC